MQSVVRDVKANRVKYMRKINGIQYVEGPRNPIMGPVSNIACRMTQGYNLRGGGAWIVNLAQGPVSH